MNKIYFRVDGVDYDNFLGISFTKTLSSFCAGFVLRMSDRKNAGSKFNGQSLCEILIDDNKLFTGYISELSGNIDNGKHSIQLKGNEKTVDLIESDFSKSIDISNGIKLEDIIRKCLDTIGLDCKVYTDLIIPKFSNTEKISSEMGDNIFDFIDGLCNKRQVVINTDINGNIILQRANTIYQGAVIQSITGNNTNNVLSSSFTENFSKRFYKYICRCEDGSTGELNDDFNNRKAVSIDSSIRKTRIRDITLEALDIETLKKRAVWEKNFRLNNGVYMCKVKGFYNNIGQIYYPNQLCLIKDDTWGIETKMLLSDVSYSQDSSGSFSDLTFVNPLAYDVGEI